MFSNVEVPLEVEFALLQALLEAILLPFGHQHLQITVETPAIVVKITAIGGLAIATLRNFDLNQDSGLFITTSF